jgi:hypothetical protein
VLALCARPVRCICCCVGTSVSDLMVGFAPFHGARCRCVAVFHIKTTREASIPICIPFDWGCGVTHLSQDHWGKWTWASKLIGGCKYAPSLLVPYHCSKCWATLVSLTSFSLPASSPSTAASSTSSAVVEVLLAPTVRVCLVGGLLLYTRLVCVCLYPLVTAVVF